jgi:hypothetical protein
MGVRADPGKKRGYRDIAQSEVLPCELMFSGEYGGADSSARSYPQT